MKQGLFEVFGEGKFGLKADDLSQYSEALTNCGFTVPEGMVIATGIFDQLVERLTLSEGVLPEDMEKRSCPDFLLSVNEEILGRMEAGKPYAIRSSALSERGGTGIYKSVFFWPTGNKDADLQGLWRCEAQVYASEFTHDARLWRERNNAPVGMAILIQPVIGSTLGQHFLPDLAGTAYTSYQGLQTVRAVVGLGTKAVNGGGKIYNRPLDDLLELGLDMWNQNAADAISQNGIEQIRTHSEEIYGRVCYGCKPLNELFPKLSQLQTHGNFYLEWAICGDTIFIVQCAPYEDKLPGDLSFDSNDYFMLLEGKDVLHSGRATCKCVVYVDGWSAKIAHLLEVLNEQIKGHLLIVPQYATSQLADNGGYDYEDGFRLQNQRLGFCHFSNALAVVEQQYHYTRDEKVALLQAGMPCLDHDEVGASHFSQLCDRADILFIGAKFDPEPLSDLPGRIRYRDNGHITIWNTTAEVVVDAIKKWGFVYISKQAMEKRNNFSQSQIQEWSHDLRMTANYLNDSGNCNLATLFYNVHYAIGPDGNPVEFDQFDLDKEAVEMCGGMGKLTESLKAVIDNGGRFVNPEIWNNGLRDYLEKLLAHLTQ